MKKLIIVIIIILIIIMVTGTIIVIKEKKNTKNTNKYSDELQKLIDKDTKYDKLLEIKYSNSGNSLGNVDITTLYVNDNILTKEFATTHDEPIKITEYKVSKDNISYFKDMIKEYNFPAWRDLEMSDLIALDGPTRSITFVYDNTNINNRPYEAYTIYYDMLIPDDGREALKQIEKELLSLPKEKNKIKEYTRK